MFIIRKYVYCLLAGLVCVFGCSSRNHTTTIIPNRIVSLAPSITETLFAFGLGEKVVGVTTYCRYPACVKTIEKVGGYSDANVEKIIVLKPDLVILQSEHEKQREYLERYGINTLAVSYNTCAEICSSFTAVGKACGVTEKADSLVALFQKELAFHSNNPKRPRVLLCVGRDNPGAGNIQSVFIAGTGTYYNELIESAGGMNAFADTLPRYPRLSSEGMITIAPDIVIDVAPSMGDYSCETLVNDWKSSTMIPAVKNGNVYCLSNDYTTNPGPRILLLLKDLRTLIGSVTTTSSRDVNR